MEGLFIHVWLTFKDMIDNWGTIVVLSGCISWIYRRFTKQFYEKQENQLKSIQMHIKRIELLQAINHDYGIQIVSGIFDEYEALGGNHYAHDRFEQYKREKEEK